MALGQVLLKRGDYDGAITHLQIAIRLKPDLASGHFALGKLFQQKVSRRGDRAVARGSQACSQ